MLTVPYPMIEILASRLQHSCAVLLMLSVLSMTMDLYTLKNVYSDFWWVIVNPDFFAFLAAASVLFSARGTRGVLRSAQYMPSASRQSPQSSQSSSSVSF